MALLGNYSVLNKTCGKFIGGSTTGDHAFLRSNFNKAGASRNFFASWVSIPTLTALSSVPNGSSPPYSWIMSIKSGGLAIYHGTDSSGIIATANLAGGLNASSTITASGDITTANINALGLVLSTILAQGSVTADIIGKLDASATLAGAGDMVGSLSSLIDILATLAGSSSVNASLGAGVFAVSNIAGSSTFNADITAVLQAASTIVNSSSFSADVIGTWNLATTLQGSSTLVADLKALGNLVAAIVGSSSLTSGSTGPGNMSANITPFTDLSPESLASAIWNSVAASYNNPGTLGEKVNDAGSATNPWTEDLSGGYPAGSAGYILANLITTIPESVWEDLKSNHTTDGTVGKAITDLEIISKQIKGLAAANL